MNQKLDFSVLQQAIRSLTEAIDVVSNSAWFKQQKQGVQNTLVAGVVQNFEFVYELSIKMLKRQLKLESVSPEDIDFTSFRGLLRIAAEKGLIQNIEVWFQYRELRNITSHTYDHEKARYVYEMTLVFLNDANTLLKTLEQRDEY
ncbi:MAG: hypothetical protein HFP77_01880 [Methylococcales symbiont of Iophon sp. n. MRB-2018]|nr:MAG: hypothetical protein HFP77_01880 [Methylococcales symbiont of Iophon sp. n. MRB-2018]KAF3980544.1 MAG: hypothetical protein HFP76_01595 [Methylococcales symbiont of Iophon sp. n. MRB-2018]